MLYKLKVAWQGTWRNSIVAIPLLTILWSLFGWLLASNLFDHYDSLKVLGTKNDSLTYVSLLFAVQIPIFILLLERMGGAGYIRRLVLPGVIKFRELLVSYIWLSLLLLISARASYYYFPIVALTLLSLFIIVESVKVMFEQTKLRDRENSFVRNLVKNVIDISLNHRITSNKFLEEVKDLKRVTYTLFDIHDRYPDAESLEVRADRPGVIKDIDVKRIEELVTQNFSTLNTKEEAAGLPQKTDLPKVVVSVRPGATVKSQDQIMRLIMDSDSKTSEKFIALLRKSTRIEPKNTESVDLKLGDLITDFKQQLRDAVDRDNVVSLQQSLEFYRILLDGFTSFSRAVSGSEYEFSNARQEFRQFLGDNVSKQITEISDLINNELQHAIRDNRRDTSKEIISFVYSELLSSIRGEDVLRAAFADYSMSYAINRLVYADLNTYDPHFRGEIFDYILTRYKEHTGLLLYNYRKDDISDEHRNFLKQLIESRLDDSRGFLMATYKRQEFNLFKEVFGVFNEFEKDFKYHEDQLKEFVPLTRCNLMVVASHTHKSDQKSESRHKMKDILDSYFNELSPLEITELLVTCIDAHFAENWRIDVWDLPMDGQMHSVPNFNDSLKEFWADNMLSRTSFPKDTSSYESISLGPTPAFTDGHSDDHKAFLMQYLEKLQEEGVGSAKDLKELVKKFIKRRREWEEDTVANAELDKEQINDFRNEIVNGYDEHAFAKQIYTKAGKVKEIKKPSKKYKMLGWNQIREKPAFASLENWHIGYALDGKERGAEIARKQNELITELIFKKPTKTKNIEDWLSRIKKIKGKWVIFNVNTGSWFIRDRYARYLKKETEDNKIFFKEIDQFNASNHIYHDSVKDGLYAVQPNHLGTLNIKIFNDEFVEVLVDAYSHNKKLLDSILSKPPKWLRDKGNRDSQIKFLKIMVRMYIYHTYRFDPHPNPKVYYLEIDEGF